MIHPTAVIDKEVMLGRNVNIGAYAVIEKKVRLGDAVDVAPYVHIRGNTSIGDNTFIGTGALIGSGAQMLGLRKNDGRITIGKNNTIREYVTINSATLRKNKLF